MKFKIALKTGNYSMYDFYEREIETEEQLTSLMEVLKLILKAEKQIARV
jgi:hypothetical protein